MNGGIQPNILKNLFRSFSTKCAKPNEKPSRHWIRKERTPVLPYNVPELFELDSVQVHSDVKWWNIPQSLLSLLGRRIFEEPNNPLCLLKLRIINHFNEAHRHPRNLSPLFTICDQEPRLVSVFDNFDSLLTPPEHPSRRLSDTYYVNAVHCLRSHTSAHQHSLIRQGLDNFLVVGDVFRRDLIDCTHHSCFHQIEGVRTFSLEDLFGPCKNSQFSLFVEESTARTPQKQEHHNIEASNRVVRNLKHALEALVQQLFGPNIQMRWVNTYFPFTHPSFELEILFADQWLEVLGCGVIEQKLMESAGAGSRIGWAFGVGLERLAMILYGIPDIRLFWSRDSGFISQFSGATPDTAIKYRQISVHPQLFMDLSFWLPEKEEPESCGQKFPKTENGEESSQAIQSLADNCDEMKSNVMDTIRSVGGDLVEQVNLKDEFLNIKTGRTSQCYRVVYRNMERALTKDEVNYTHQAICVQLSEQFGVEIR